MPLIDVPTIHAVTDPQILSDPGFLGQAEGVFRALGPNGAVHLRGPGIAASRLFAMAVRLADLARTTGCRLVINDRADIAAAIPAWGVQLGQGSMDPADARSVAPGVGIGVSVHSVGEAERATNQLADWLVAGHIFATPSHRARPGHGIRLITVAAAFGRPVIAIGGVLPSHVPALREAGAHGVAAIRGIWGSADPGAAARAYLQAS